MNIVVERENDLKQREIIESFISNLFLILARCRLSGTLATPQTTWNWVSFSYMMIVEVCEKKSVYESNSHVYARPYILSDDEKLSS